MQPDQLDKKRVWRRPATFGLAILCVLLAAAGCVSDGPQAAGARTLTVNLTASSNANPSPDGNSSPLPVQVYVLKSPGNFQALDYFDLKNGSAIAADQVDSRGVSLRPGETKQITMSTGMDGAYIGVAAGYRAIDSATWRAMTAIGSAEVFNVRAGRSSVTISGR